MRLAAITVVPLPRKQSITMSSRAVLSRIAPATRRHRLDRHFSNLLLLLPNNGLPFVRGGQERLSARCFSSQNAASGGGNSSSAQAVAKRPRSREIIHRSPEGWHSLDTSERPTEPEAESVSRIESILSNNARRGPR